MQASTKKKQLNVQISEDAYMALRAAAFVDNARSIAGLAGPVIEDYAAKRSKEKKVAGVLKARVN